MEYLTVVSSAIFDFISSEVGVPRNEIHPDISLGALGVGSVHGAVLIAELEERFGVELSPLMIYEHPTIRKLSEAVVSLVVENAAPREVDSESGDPMLPKMSIEEAVRSWAITTPDKCALIFLGTDGSEECTLTYRELWSKVEALASYLEDVTNEGDRVALSFPQSPEFTIAFLACLLIGRVAIPLPEARLESIEKVANICANGESCFGLCDALSAEVIEQCGEIGTSFFEYRIDMVLARNEPPREALEYRVDGLASLEYTSGSTAAPKGVMCTRAGFFRTVGMMREAWALTEDSTVVSWWPHHHIMGLVVGQLLPLAIGARLVLMAPRTFVFDPNIWLSAISRYRADFSGGPDFAFAHAAKRFRRGRLDHKLDLSRWRVAISGGEGVRLSTITDFTGTFEAYGFQKNSLVPCLGMTEATLFISGGPVGRPTEPLSVDRAALQRGECVVCRGPSNETTEIFGLGVPSPQLEAVIVDPVSLRRQGSDKIGELWLHGPSIAAGYWSNDSETDIVFHAHIMGEGDKRYLRTGDLGFIGPQGGQLFLCGRIKELIIWEGRNIFPVDVEEEIIKALHTWDVDSCAVFSIEGDQSTKIISIIALRSLNEPVISEELIVAKSTVRDIVSQKFNIPVSAVEFIGSQSMAKTASGKIQRLRMQRLYTSGSLEVISDIRL